MQTADDVQCQSLLAVLLKLATATGDSIGSLYVANLMKDDLLDWCLHLRSVKQIKETTDLLLTWFINRVLVRSGEQSIVNPLAVLAHSVKQMPVKIDSLARWLSAGKSVPFADKSTALIAMYHVELCRLYK